MRCVWIMKILKRYLCLSLLAVLCAKAFAQPASAPARSNAVAGPVPHAGAVDPVKMSGQKDARVDTRAVNRADSSAKRGSDLRLALTPQNMNSSTTANLKTQGGLATVADTSTPEPLPEHHLNVKERLEMRELLRQQRLKQPQN